MLYRAVASAWVTVRLRLELRERPLPRFCQREVDAYLRCVALAHSFARVWCEACWTDGTTHVVMEPEVLIERLLALVPPPRRHLVTYHGVLAPAAQHGPACTERQSVRSLGDAPPPRRRYPWAELLRRVFEIDVFVCPHCGGVRRLLAAITEPAAIEKVLRAVGLPGEVAQLAPARAPPRAPPREPEWWGA